MKKFVICCAFALLNISVANASVANVADEKPSWQTCLDKQNKESADIELNCYRQVAQATPPAEARQKSLMPLRAHKLVDEWAPSNDPLNIYKQNYLLVYARSNATNDSPTSPNPQNRVLTPSPLDKRNVKLQFSIKHDLTDFGRYGSLWLGYTQQSFWQLYDAANSRPFRENNYEPELIYSINPDKLIGDSKLNPSMINLGLVHQSNGQTDPKSRSWNRIYIQPGIEHFYGEDNRLVVLARWWHRIKEDIATDNNPDITHYLGNGDIEVRYSHGGKWEAAAIARTHSIQLDFSAPWTVWRLLTLSSIGAHNTNLHFQYFNGYGESLIDYNHKHQTWGVGLSFPFE
jgi:phospholipase A1